MSIIPTAQALTFGARETTCTDYARGVYSEGRNTGVAEMAYTPALTPDQARTLAAYIRTGRVAHLYPRKRCISLNGNRLLPIADAMAQMRACLDATNPPRA